MDWEDRIRWLKNEIPHHYHMFTTTMGEFWKTSTAILSGHIMLSLAEAHPEDAIMLGIIGESNSAKSVLAKCLNNYFPDFVGKIDFSNIISKDIKKYSQELGSTKGKGLLICTEIDDNQYVPEKRFKILISNETEGIEVKFKNKEDFNHVIRLLCFSNYPIMVEGEGKQIQKRIAALEMFADEKSREEYNEQKRSTGKSLKDFLFEEKSKATIFLSGLGLSCLKTGNLPLNQHNIELGWRFAGLFSPLIIKKFSIEYDECNKMEAEKVFRVIKIYTEKKGMKKRVTYNLIEKGLKTFLNVSKDIYVLETSKKDNGKSVTKKYYKISIGNMELFTKYLTTEDEE
ncbi:MAG: hypothetical protein OXE77_00145 [Flavobacteriaceae bacterium]|nr:hypothetical protein [Flavobacteriaceae bacterium]MCY4266996.1 hypothetical protein [Flavobacteriaceae bacterium]